MYVPQNLNCQAVNKCSCEMKNSTPFQFLYMTISIDVDDGCWFIDKAHLGNVTSLKHS